VLLLLYEDTEANLALMRRVLSACHGLRHLPRLVGVHPEPATHVPLVAFARSLGHAYEPAFVRPEDPATCWPGVVDLVPPCADTQDAGDSLGAELAA
jgi:hypothetical protein